MENTLLCKVTHGCHNHTCSRFLDEQPLVPEGGSRIRLPVPWCPIDIRKERTVNSWVDMMLVTHESPADYDGHQIMTVPSDAQLATQQIAND